MEKNEKRGRTEKKRGRRAKRRCDWPGRGEKCRERRSPTPRQNTGPSSADRGNITLVLIIITRALRLWCSWCIGLMQTLQTYWILNFSAYSKLRKEKRTKKHFFKLLRRQKEKGGKMDPFNRDWWKRGDACDILAPSSIWVCLIWVIWPLQLCLAYI